jgi:hypothetical protein
MAQTTQNITVPDPYCLHQSINVEEWMSVRINKEEERAQLQQK